MKVKPKERKKNVCHTMTMAHKHTHTFALVYYIVLSYIWIKKSFLFNFIYIQGSICLIYNRNSLFLNNKEWRKKKNITHFISSFAQFSLIYITNHRQTENIDLPKWSGQRQYMHKLINMKMLILLLVEDESRQMKKIVF